MTLSRIRISLGTALCLLVATAVLAHSFMDLAVTVHPPAYLRAGQTERVDVLAEVRAFDPAVAVVITVETSASFTSYSAPSAWRCTREAKQVRCTADELIPGPHAFTVDVTVPGSGTVNLSAGISSIASDDPDFGNNIDAFTSAVYATSSCTAQAPVIVSSGPTGSSSTELLWSASAGASSYEVLAGIDGETPHVIGTTTTPRFATRLLGGGEVTWIVRATFANCPSLASAPSTFTTAGAETRLAVGSLTSPLFNEPVSIAFEGTTALIADAGKRQILSLLAGDTTVFAEALDGETQVAPLATLGGIAVGPGRFLYIADRGIDLVRYAYPTFPRVVFTVAGMPHAAGSNDGTGTAARVRAPYSVAVDDRSQVYISDSGNHTIRRGVFDPPKGEFTITTFAGVAGQSGAADGIGTGARFNDPAGIAVDAAGNVFVADRGNHTVRRITKAGQVATIAGVAGEAGHRDGAGSQALFNQPVGVAVDGYGNVLVTEEGNHTVRKIAPNGRVTTIAGQPGAAGDADGVGAGVRFNRPAMLAIHPDGTIWIADAGNGKVRRATYQQPSGPKRRSAGGK